MPIGRYGTQEKSRQLLAEGDECPECGKPMRVKHRKIDGKGFLGCSGYDYKDSNSCKHTENEWRDKPAMPDLPRQEKPYSTQAAAGFKTSIAQKAVPATAHVGEFTEFELGLLKDAACEKVRMTTDEVWLGIVLKLERCLEKFKARTPVQQAMVEAAIPAGNGPQVEF